MGNKDSEFYFF